MAEHFTAKERPEEFLSAWMDDGLGVMKKFKPNDRSPKDRTWAIAITKMEEVIAWWDKWVLGDPNGGDSDDDKKHTTIFGYQAGPGDIIGLHVSYYTTKEDRDLMEARLQTYWPDNEIMIIESGMSVEVIPDSDES